MALQGYFFKCRDRIVDGIIYVFAHISDRAEAEERVLMKFPDVDIIDFREVAPGDPILEEYPEGEVRQYYPVDW